MTNELTTKEKVEVINKRVGKLVRSFRRDRGISQKELGAYLGISSQQIQKYERGLNRTPVAYVECMADLFCIPVADFFTPANITAEYTRGKPHIEIVRIISKLCPKKLIHIRRLAVLLAKIKSEDM